MNRREKNYKLSKNSELQNEYNSRIKIRSTVIWRITYQNKFNELIEMQEV